MNQFQRTKVKALINGGKPVYAVHRPKHHNIIATSSASTPFSLGLTRKGWIDVASADVVHYGIVRKI